MCWQVINLSEQNQSKSITKAMALAKKNIQVLKLTANPFVKLLHAALTPYAFKEAMA